MNARIELLTLLLRIAGHTWRVEMEGPERLEAARRSSRHGKVIYCFWHSGLAVLAYTYRHRRVHALVSQHRDGGWIAGVLQRLGHGVVRGSSRRGGTEAVFRLVRVLESGHDVSLAVDGPIGPRHRLQAGALLLARRSGAPIVPLIVTVDRGFRLRTWDELRLPRLGARVRVRHLDPIHVPEDLAAGEMTDLQRRVEATMREGTRRDEARWGNEVDLDDVQDRRSYWERWSEQPSPARWLRGAARLHGLLRRADRRVRPRPMGHGRRPWVIGVGNLEAGGTGKTPVVLDLARRYHAAGIRVALLLRGHGGGLGNPPRSVTPDDLAAASDETRLYRHALAPVVPIMVARHRAAGLELLRRDFDLDVVLVDDAFQTSGLAVDRHLVLLDATAPLGNGWLLPAGRLREPPAALVHAHAILFTRDQTGVVPQHPAWEAQRRTGMLFTASEEVAALRAFDGGPTAWEALRGAGIATLCGIGRPAAFEAAMRDLGARHGFDVRRAVRAGDHAPLESLLGKLLGRLEGLGCRYVVVTEKDRHRLGPEWNEPLLVAEQRLRFEAGSQLAAALLPDQLSAKLATLTVNDTGT